MDGLSFLKYADRDIQPEKKNSFLLYHYNYPLRFYSYYDNLFITILLCKTIISFQFC